jgi:hypothetical protein
VPDWESPDGYREDVLDHVAVPVGKTLQVSVDLSD